MWWRSILQTVLNNNASDLHLTIGRPPALRIDGKLFLTALPAITTHDIDCFLAEQLSLWQQEQLTVTGSVDFTYLCSGLGRFRVNAFRQQGQIALALRVIMSIIPSLAELGLPSLVYQLTCQHHGLVLAVGATGSGKSTTLAAMIQAIIKSRSVHILTLEDPIEYVFESTESLIHQRELVRDFSSFAVALRSALREDPDVILLGELRDLDTIATAITAAETGHLVLASLHTATAVQAVERIVSVFPAEQQQRVQWQLANVLQGIIAQRLLPLRFGAGRIAAVELLAATPAVRNLIREGKFHQLTGLMQTGARFGMQTMDAAVSDLYQRQLITREHLQEHITDPMILAE